MASEVPLRIASRASTSSPAAPIPLRPGSSTPVPRSEYLREALLGGKSTPRAESSLRRASLTPKPLKDDWIKTAEEEERKTPKNSLRRVPPHARRNSLQGAVQRSTPPPHVLGNREYEATLDRLRKENFDLKIRITLQQEYATKLKGERDEAIAQAERAREWQQKLEDVEKEKEQWLEDRRQLEEENSFLQESNKELSDMNDELVEEMGKKDEAIEEAVEMINALQARGEALEKELSDQKAREEAEKLEAKHDSDYFSGGEHGSVMGDQSSTYIASRPSTSYQGSDYFSGPSSPLPVSSQEPAEPAATTPQRASALTRRMKILVRSSTYTLRVPGDPRSRGSLKSEALESVVSQPPDSPCPAQPPRPSTSHAVPSKHQHRLRSHDSHRQLPKLQTDVVTGQEHRDRPETPKASGTPTAKRFSLLRVFSSRTLPSADAPAPAPANAPNPSQPEPDDASSVASHHSDTTIGAPSEATESSFVPPGTWKPGPYPMLPRAGQPVPDFIFNWDGVDELAPSSNPSRWLR